MILDRQRRAICRIYVPIPGGRRGTGFLIAEHLVMTAAHVVEKAGDKAGDKRAPYAGEDIELLFGGTFQPIRARVVAKHFDAANDWAVLELLPAGTSVPGATPFRAAALVPVARLRWDTFGYSERAEVPGQAYFGEVVTASDRFQLRVDPTEGSPQGLSGSPCIVDGEVVGVIIQTSSLKTTDTLFAQSMCSIQTAGCSEFTLNAADAPYSADAQTRLRDFENDLAPAAVRLGFATNVQEAQAIFNPGRMLPRVAAAMMGGLGPTLDAIHSLKGLFSNKWPDQVPPATAHQLLKLAGRAWIDAAAVKRLHHLLLEGDKLVILNTDQPELARLYVHRAGCLDMQHPGRFELSDWVDATPPGFDKVVQAFDDTVVRLINREPTAEEALASHNHDLNPIVVWFSGLPKRSVIERLQKKATGYDRVRLMFLVGYDTLDTVHGEYDDAERVTPAPVRDDFAAALTKLEQKEVELKNLFARKVDL